MRILYTPETIIKFFQNKNMIGYVIFCRPLLRLYHFAISITTKYRIILALNPSHKMYQKKQSVSTKK